MSLWGKNDNVTSAGTVWLNYATGVCTGSGTGFAAADVGRVIRFGFRGSGGTYMGDAVIKTRTSATEIAIGSTAGLSGVAIAGTDYYLSELPKSTVLDHGWSNKHDTNPTYQSYKVVKANDFAASNTVAIGASIKGLGLDASLLDALEVGGTDIVIAGVGTATATTTSPSAVGFSTVYLVTPPGVGLQAGDSITNDGVQIPITSIAATSIGLASTISAQITGGSAVTLSSDNVISLASTTSVAISTGTELHFKRLQGGYDRQIYGISTSNAQHYGGVSSKYRTDGAGWVGVTTYRDCHGKLRVKSEILVAIGSTLGITTGANGITYPTSPQA